MGIVMKRVGSRAQVMHQNALQTAGGLKKKDLKYNKYGKIVSKRASVAAKKTKNLQKAGYVAKKGAFGAIFVGGNASTSNPKSNNRQPISNEERQKRRENSERRRAVFNKILKSKNFTVEIETLRNKISELESTKNGMDTETYHMAV